MSDTELNGSRAPLWWQLKSEKERCDSVVRTADSLERLHAERRTRALQNIEAYEGRRLGGLYPAAYLKSVEYSTDEYDHLRLNEARSITNTAIAKIAGKQRPRAQFVTSEADWSIKRKAKKLEKFVDAVMLQRQNGLTDAFAVGLLMFRDLCVADSGWLKFWADNVQKRVCIQRVFPWEILFDPNEARYGEPQNLFHVYGHDRFLLLEQFPDREADIMNATGLEEYKEGGIMYGFGTDTSNRMVKVRECWRLSPGGDRPGKHSIVISGPDGGIDLTVTKDNPEGEEYTRTFFPFEGMSWEPWVMGVYGTSLVENVMGLCDELNASIQRRAEAEKLGSNMVIFAEEGAVDVEDLEDNRPAIVVTVKPGARIPEFRVPETASQASIQWGEQLQRWIHDASGMSSQDSAAQKQPGLESGVAIREIRDIGSERFAIQWQNYERIMAIGASRQIIACMRELAESSGDDVVVKWPGGKYLQEIPWSKVSLEDDQYHCQVYSVSGLVNTPADRLALATELVDRGFMSKEVYLRVIQAKDIDDELGKVNSISTWVEKCIEEWLDADEDEPIHFRGPPPRWLGAQTLTDTIIQVGIAYLDADMDNAPPYNLQFFERYMKETDRICQELMALQHPPAPAAPPGNTAPVAATPPAAAPAQAAPTPPPVPAPAAPPVSQ